MLHVDVIMKGSTFKSIIWFPNSGVLAKGEGVIHL